MIILQIPVLSDNYVYLLRDEARGVSAVVDPAEAEPVKAELAKRGWRLDMILNTHHHGDHVGGNRSLKAAFGCEIVGPRADAARIPLIDRQVGEGDEVAVGSARAVVHDTPGHTRGHIVYHFAGERALFCGDTLFALGCGRLFEGAPEEMHASLAKLKALPGDTRVYCAHEYTEANWNFAKTVEPGNAALARRGDDIRARRDRGEPTVPSTIAEELATNPFLRVPDAARFAEVRRAKDHFRG